MFASFARCKVRRADWLVGVTLCHFLAPTGWMWNLGRPVLEYLARLEPQQRSA
jgi:hypothetical protein